MGFDLASKTYLVIDDFADMRSMLRSMLVAYGVTNIEMVGNGKDAIKMLAKKTYDVVLCDYNLGEGKDGQQVLEECDEAAEAELDVVDGAPGLTPNSRVGGQGDHDGNEVRVVEIPEGNKNFVKEPEH